MLALMLLIILSFVIPYRILRPFNGSQKMLVMAMVAGHVIVMLAWHWHVVETTDFPIIMDAKVDTQKYYWSTMYFADRLPFGVSIRDVKASLAARYGETKHIGYPYVLALLWTLTPYGILAVRLFKTMLFFVSLSFLARVWRTDYGDRLAMWGFVFLGVIFTPAVLYNFRNLKDGLLLALFMFLMALLDTLLRPRERRLYPMSRRQLICSWAAVLFLLYAISTVRIYSTAIVMVAVTMHLVTASKMGIKARISLLLALTVIGLAGLQSGFFGNIVAIGSGRIRKLTLFTVYGLGQAFLSPLPWNPELERYLAFFYWIYWALFPYTIYAVVRHLRKNMTWHLYLYLMVSYVASGGIIGDPPRKRLVVHPIMVGWILAHLAYVKGKNLVSASRMSESEVLEDYDYSHDEEHVLVGAGEDYTINGD